MRLLNVVGTRPNFMKIAPLQRALARYPDRFSCRLVHTGQHYDINMSDVFFQDLSLPTPDITLGVGSGSHAAQTAEVMIRFEQILPAERPDLVVVVGDVNSTLACALVAAKCRIPIAHIEAGPRAYNRSIPEEVNRVLTDHLSDHLFAFDEESRANLLKEGISGDRIHVVGDVMIDSLLDTLPRADARRCLTEAGVNGRYAVLTMHRPANVDDPAVFREILSILREVHRKIPMIFPIHPRSRKSVRENGFEPELMESCVPVDPLGYVEFVGLMKSAALVITDSGSIQRETTVLNIPCLTLRHDTENALTLTKGTNVLVARDRQKILECVERALAGQWKKAEPIPLWDGRASERIVEILRRAGG